MADYNVKLHGSFKGYIFGFMLSIIFTLIPFLLVINKTITGMTLVVVVLAFALAQVMVQLFLFLHVGEEKPRWNFNAFLYTFFVFVVVIIGSVWIMVNLGHHAASEHGGYMMHQSATENAQEQQTNTHSSH